MLEIRRKRVFVRLDYSFDLGSVQSDVERVKEG